VSAADSDYGAAQGGGRGIGVENDWHRGDAENAEDPLFSFARFAWKRETALDDGAWGGFLYPGRDAKDLGGLGKFRLHFSRQMITLWEIEELDSFWTLLSFLRSAWERRLDAQRPRRLAVR
jgi:hypothetical protein